MLANVDLSVRDFFRNMLASGSAFSCSLYTSDTAYNVDNGEAFLSLNKIASGIVVVSGFSSNEYRLHDIPVNAIRGTFRNNEVGKDNVVVGNLVKIDDVYYRIKGLISATVLTTAVVMVRTEVE